MSKLRIRLIIRSLIFHRSRSLAIVIQSLLAVVAICLSFSLILGRSAGLLPRDLMQVTIYAGSSSSLPIFRDRDLKELEQKFNHVKGIAAYRTKTRVELHEGGRRFHIRSVLETSANFPTVFGLSELLGDTRLSADTTMPALLLEERAAQNIFGSIKNALGARVTILENSNLENKQTARVVTGVYRLQDNGEGSLDAQAIWYSGFPLSTLLIRSAPGSAPQVKDVAGNVLRKYYDNFSSRITRVEVSTKRTAPSGFQQEKDLTDPMLAVFSGFGIVLLASSVLGIYATGLASVTERELELATQLALGRPHHDLSIEWLLQIFILSVAGSLIGVITVICLLILIRHEVGYYLFGKSLVIYPSVLLCSAISVVVLIFLASLQSLLSGVRIRPVALFRGD